METNSLLIDIAEGIGTLTLNKPQRHNAFNDEMIDELTTALRELDRDQSIRLVLLKAAGKNFSAGADLAWMKQMIHYSFDHNVDDAMKLVNLLKILNRLSKPTIAMVQGLAYGGALGLLACCDIVIAHENAQFCFSEAKLGLIPATIAPYIVKAIGFRQARYLFLTALPFGARQALELGLIHQVVTSDDVEQACQKIILALLDNGPHALMAIKSLMNDLEPCDENKLNQTAKILAQIRISPEAQEGIEAFLEKRLPSWRTA